MKKEKSVRYIGMSTEARSVYLLIFFGMKKPWRRDEDRDLVFSIEIDPWKQLRRCTTTKRRTKEQWIFCFGMQSLKPRMRLRYDSRHISWYLDLRGNACTIRTETSFWLRTYGIKNEHIWDRENVELNEERVDRTLKHDLLPRERHQLRKTHDITILEKMMEWDGIDRQKIE